MSEIRHISYETAIAINKVMTESFGGLSGIRDSGLLESALGQPFQTFARIDLYPTIPEKAARLAFGIVKNHPFIDGNKRTAAACMAAFLKTNDYNFEPEVGDLADKFIALSADEIDWGDFYSWVLRYC